MTRFECHVGVNIDAAGELLAVGRHCPIARWIGLPLLHELWQKFSASRDASWLIVSKETIEDFTEWMEEEI